MTINQFINQYHCLSMAEGRRLLAQDAVGIKLPDGVWERLGINEVTLKVPQHCQIQIGRILFIVVDGKVHRANEIGDINEDTE